MPARMRQTWGSWSRLEVIAERSVESTGGSFFMISECHGERFFRESAGLSMVPAVIPSLTKAGLEVVGRRLGRREERLATWTRREYAAKGRQNSSHTRGRFRPPADIVIQVLSTVRTTSTGKADVSLYRPNQALHRFLAPPGIA